MQFHELCEAFNEDTGKVSKEWLTAFWPAFDLNTGMYVILNSQRREIKLTGWLDMLHAMSDRTEFVCDGTSKYSMFFTLLKDRSKSILSLVNLLKVKSFVRFAGST